jgi:hypothetical protein
MARRGAVFDDRAAGAKQASLFPRDRADLADPDPGFRGQLNDSAFLHAGIAARDTP